MLKKVTTGVFVHTSEVLESQTIVIQGNKGVLLVDPGLTIYEMADLADDLQELGQSVVAGFSTHPDWDHVLWHQRFGDVPRYGTVQNASVMNQLLSQPSWKAQVTEVLPPENATEVPLDDFFGKITPLPDGVNYVPWDGPKLRVLEHQAHAFGHAALFLEDQGVLIAGDMLSDTLIPFINLEAEDPLGDYLSALQLFENIAGDVVMIIPGHGSSGDGTAFQRRIEQDRVYVKALARGDDSEDARLSTGPNKEWLPDVYNWQVQQLVDKRKNVRMSR